MNFKQLASMQKVLDERIVKEHQLEGKNLEENKILALLVEISELANETRCFKHWSVKGPSEKNILLEEYVDSLHFFLSIANVRNYDLDAKRVEWVAEETSLVTHFKNTMSYILQIEQDEEESVFRKAFSAYLQLGRMLGFTEAEIETAYIEKNEINHQRQENGY